MSLFNLMQGSEEQNGEVVHGVVIGIVTNNMDSENMGE